MLFPVSEDRHKVVGCLVEAEFANNPTPSLLGLAPLARFELFELTPEIGKALTIILAGKVGLDSYNADVKRQPDSLSSVGTRMGPPLHWASLVDFWAITEPNNQELNRAITARKRRASRSCPPRGAGAGDPQFA